MNEASWISVLLADILEDARIMELVEKSCQLTGK